MSSNPSLLRPEDCALLLVDLQAGLAFGVGSEDRQVLLNNAVALARTAQVFGIPVVASTSATKVYSGPMMPAIQTALPGVDSDRTSQHERLGRRSRAGCDRGDGTEKTVDLRPSDGSLRYLRCSFGAGERFRGFCGRRRLRRSHANQPLAGAAAARGAWCDDDELDTGTARTSARLDQERNLRRSQIDRGIQRRRLRHRPRIRKRHDSPIVTIWLTTQPRNQQPTQPRRQQQCPSSKCLRLRTARSH